MRFLRKNEGFTLVELMVTVLAGTLVTMAAATVLLMGAKVNRQSMDTVQRQNTTRILLTMVENMASEGAICKIDSTPDGWTIYADTDGDVNTDPVAVLAYVSEKQEIQAAGEALLEGVYASHVIFGDEKLMTFSVETEDGSFVTSVFCRTVTAVEETPDEEPEIPEEIIPEEKPETGLEEKARLDFLQKLASQYRLAGGAANTGLILDVTGRSTGKYYTEWYVEQIGGVWGQNGWYANTPWCACFLSWGLENAGATMPKGALPRFANVDKFMEAFGPLSKETPKPGDIVFFDWIVNGEENPQHVGAVLAVRDGYVYTIEGNSAGVVAMRRYELSDPRILGYGVLNWQ